MTSVHKGLVTRKDVSDAFEAAEDAIKRNERLTLSLPLPAVNQLRYAAYHMRKAGWDPSESDDEAYHLERAMGHCRRSRFDALDGIVYSCLDFITAFQKLCRSRHDLMSEYPEYRSDYDKMADIQDRLQGLRKVQDMSDEELSQMEEIASRVISFKRKVLRLKVRVERLECIRADDEAIVAAQQFLVPFVATVLGTFTGVVGLFVTMWPLLPKSLWIRWSLVALVACVLVLGLRRFYRWAARHMLTARQQSALEKYHFKFK